MKSLLLIRHAKSEWNIMRPVDFDRPLNPRGHNDAPMMAKRLMDKAASIDAFVSSPANRALTTATYFAEAYHQTPKQIIQIPELYHAPESVFYDVVQGLNNAWESVAIFSHNPGITAFVNGLTDAHIDNMPTCCIFAIKADINDWKDFQKGVKKFWFCDFPKA